MKKWGMTKKDARQRVQMCSRKRLYLTRGDAEAAADKLRKDGEPRARAYQCPWCKHWHVGKRKEED